MSQQDDAIDGELQQLLTALGKARESLEDPRYIARLLEEVRSLCRSKLVASDGLRRVMDSQDLAQEALFELVRSAESFKGTTWSEFWAFAGRIIDHKILALGRHYRAQKRDIDRRVEESSVGHDTAAQNPGPFTIGEFADDTIKLQRVISELPAQNRDALELRLQSHGYDQIARKLKISEDSARKRVSRALALLKERW